MGSHLLEVLRQGIWASLTGGWFHDPRQPILTNTIHLYLWLMLLALPLTLCAYCTSDFLTWSSYTASIAVLFVTIKFLNWRFHYLFDNSEAIEDTPKDELSPNKSELNFEGNLSKDATKSRGLSETNDIELQMLDSSNRSSGRMKKTQCLLDIEDNSAPVVISEPCSMGDLKVDVHRKESSSSCSNSTQSINRSKINNENDTNLIEEIVVIERSSNKETLEEICDSQSGPQQPPIASEDPLVGTREELMNTSNNPETTEINYRLRGTGSLDLDILSKPCLAEGNLPIIRRSASLQLNPLTNGVGRELTTFLPTASSNSEVKPASQLKTASGPKCSTSRSLQFLESVRRTTGLSRSKSSEAHITFSEPVTNSGVTDEETLRCGTPLLNQFESNGDNPVVEKSEGDVYRKASSHHGTRQCSGYAVQPNKLAKKVSFTTKASFGSDDDDEEDMHRTYSGSVSNEQATSFAGNEHGKGKGKDKKFALVPYEDSLVGWNQSGGPFTSQWLFKAVSPTPHLDLTKAPANSELCHQEESYETESLKSEGSDHSFSGLAKLFEGWSDLTSKTNSDTLAEKRVKVKSFRVPIRTLPPPKKPPRSAQSGRVIGISPRRSEREGIPRFLERLLEENQDSGPSTSQHRQNIHVRLGCRCDDGTKWLEDELPNERSARFDPWKDNEILRLRDCGPGRPMNGSGSSLRTRTPSDGYTATNPLLQSAREIKNHLKNLGPQTSLEISGSDEGRRNSCGNRNRSQSGHGFPRIRDASECTEEETNTPVNRHRRLRRLGQTRRRTNRRGDSPPFPRKRGSTHLASSHDDTTEGAVHYFQDESGEWYSYTFSENGTARVVLSEPPPAAPKAACLSTILNRIDLGSSAYLDARPGPSSGHSSAVHGTVVRTPSSSESWSSVSSSELAMDVDYSAPMNNSKLYAAYRRGIQLRPPTTISPLDTIGYHFDSSASGIVTGTMATRANLPLPGISGGANRTWQRNPRDVLSVLTESFLERRRLPTGPYGQGDGLGSTAFPHSSESNTSKRHTRYFYVMNPIPLITSIKLRIVFDRLNLMAVFDRNRSFFENILGIILAVGVAALGSYMLHNGYFRDLSVVFLSIVMASCQFSLLKSVQPDAASPTHGFNRIVAFSRPIYFCLCGLLVVLIQTALDSKLTDANWKIYGLDITNSQLLTLVRDVILTVILAFPFLFCVGVFPQVNTFFIFLLEQTDIHVFGGNAATSLSAAGITNLKNWFAVGCLYGFAFGGLGEKESTQHLLFSIFCALLVPLCYHMSRCSSDPTIMWGILKKHICPEEDCFGEFTSTTPKNREIEDQVDPLPQKLQNTVNARLKSDTIVCPLLGILVFALHASTVFVALQPGLLPVLWVVGVVVGLLLHYVIPQMRKQMPCLIMAHPVLLSGEYRQFETRDAAKLMWFEKFFAVACFFERNVLYPLLFISALTQEAGQVVREDRLGLSFGSLVVVITAMKALKSSYSDPSRHYIMVTFTVLFFKFDWEGASETFLVDFFFMSILYNKIYELWLKMQFVLSYISPWQISWGSAFHAFAQPFSVPHSAMLFLQALISSIFSAPLNPFLGSAIFITSYIRPIKFWERDYNTKRVDHSNTRVASHIDKNPGSDDNNLNSIFYEHLTRSLQESLCGDVALGRWGLVSQGDCFVLASDYLNCLVHVIEIGNRLLTFQMRGLEFRGTYCQQREVEAISEGVDEDEGCCCCEPGHLPHMLSANAAFSQRWLAWEVTVSKYVLEGYSIADNSAVSMLQVYDLRKILITYYVKSVVYYTIRADKLLEWLNSDSIRTSLKSTVEKNYAELDPVFNVNIDEDYDFTISGITRNSFCNVYHSWIQFCLSKLENGSEIDSSRESVVVSLCFALSILARRALGVAAHSNSLSSVEFFLFGLHALFKGDFRITSQRDEWVFIDMDLLRRVVSPAVRMSLKLHQDHFMCPDEYDDHNALHDAISYHDEHLVISHEGDPAWRTAVLAGREGLLALRHVFDDGADEYKIIMLNKRHLSFRVIKLNRECVRGLWAGQQQELVYLRNRDPERGSIQNAKQALRNIINSSCDQPIGYPIYVSPLTTSYAETHPQLNSLLGGPISLSKIKQSATDLWRRIRHRCGQGCSSGSSLPQEDIGDVYGGQEGTYSLAMTNMSQAIPPLTGGINLSASQSLDGSQHGGSSLSRGSVGRHLSRSAVCNVSFAKPSSSTLSSLAGFLTDANGNSRERDRSLGVETPKWSSLQKVRITDANQVYDGLNMGRRIDVIWPDDTMRTHGGRSFWQNWVPEDGMEGIIVHKWIPGHRDPKSRSITEKTILLLKIEDKYVPIADTGVEKVENDTT